MIKRRIDKNASNISILMVDYDERCIEAMTDPEKRARYFDTLWASYRDANSRCDVLSGDEPRSSGPGARCGDRAGEAQGS